MKTILLATSTVLAAVAVLAFLPVGAIAAGGNLLLIVGLLAVFAVDYRRTLRPLRLSAQIIAFDAKEQATIRLDEAA